MKIGEVVTATGTTITALAHHRPGAANEFRVDIKPVRGCDGGVDAGVLSSFATFPRTP
ncbi:hypothetical protein [Amycolatopsis sp. CA-230715]|uniref:hypothetical protein n=1 Tax=Amycolatopsis sp. CA-230715 TaxID=2745196 RepID=UPI001C036FF1|nr:hypothetical protein [Amycolatopsis sp. CA-230715]